MLRVEYEIKFKWNFEFLKFDLVWEQSFCGLMSKMTMMLLSFEANRDY